MFRLLISLVIAMMVVLALVGETEALESTTANPTLIPKPVPIKCLLRNIKSYCVPNTFKYYDCVQKKYVECPLDSYCKETVNAQGNTVAYCKSIA